LAGVAAAATTTLQESLLSCTICGYFLYCTGS